MGTIKEERDALLERKLKEMGEMGSSPHTIDKSPFFDPPNEVFFKNQDEQQDSVNSSLSIEEGIEDSMIPTGIPEEVEDEVGVDTIAQEKTKKTPQSKRSATQRESDFSEYQKRFLALNVFEKRTQFTVNKETTDLMRIILQDLGCKTTLTAYIENILRDHIREYRDLINQVTAKRRRKETIPE